MRQDSVHSAWATRPSADIDGGTQVAVNGNRQQSNNYLLDGQEINENINNTLGYNPSPDALAEIRVIASNANAEFGNVNGGTVLAVMKSGSNTLHGSVFGFLKNYNLDANSWGNDDNVVPTPKNPYTTAQFGGTLGGPIIRDKLFFFVDYEGMRYHSSRRDDIERSSRGVPHRRSVGPALGWVEFSCTTRRPLTRLRTNPRHTSNNQIPITNPVATYLFGNPKAYPLPNNPTSDPLGILQQLHRALRKLFPERPGRRKDGLAVARRGQARIPLLAGICGGRHNRRSTAGKLPHRE